MERIEFEVFSHAVNAAVVRMPTRRFPGVVIQGDSLHNLYNLADTIVQLASPHNNEDLSGEAEGLRELLAGYVTLYEAVLKEHGLDLPYPTGE